MFVLYPARRQAALADEGIGPISLMHCMSPLMADFVAEVAEEGGPLCLGAEHEP
jgi:hypothetical protein